MANSYCSSSDIIDDMPDSPLYSSTDAAYSTALAGMILSASRLIDEEVGRWPGYYYPTTDIEVRYFDGTGEDEAPIDECVLLSKLEVSESGYRGTTDYTEWTLDTDYFVYPYNYSANGIPIKKIIIEAESGKGWFVYGRKVIKVTGIFGYSSTPPDYIRRAVIIQASRWYMRAKQAYQDRNATAELGQYVYGKGLDPDIQELIKNRQIGNLI